MEQLLEVLSERPALHRVHYGVDARVERDQDHADLVGSRAELGVRPERGQQLDDQVRQPAQSVDDRDGDHDLGHSSPGLDERLLGGARVAALPPGFDPQHVHNPRIEERHDADRDSARHHDAADPVRLLQEGRGQDPDAIVTFRVVFHGNDQRQQPDEGQQPAHRRDYFDFFPGHGIFVLQRVEYSKVPLKRDRHERHG